MKRLLTYRAYDIVSRCINANLPRIICKAEVVESCEDVRKEIRSLSEEVTDMLDVVSEIVHAPGRMYRKLSDTLLDFRLAIPEDRNPTQDEEHNEKILIGLLNFADSLWNDELEENKPDVAATKHDLNTRIALTRKGVSDALLVLAMESNPTLSMFYKRIDAIETKISEGVTVRNFTGDAATDIDDIATTSRKAAAKTKKQFETCAKNGRASARAKREEAGRDALKETIIAEVNKLKRERDKNYPDRNNGGEKGPSDEHFYRIVANRHIGANGKPIYTPSQIKEWFKPSKVKRRGGHKRK